MSRNTEEQLSPMKHQVGEQLPKFEEANTDDKITRLYLTLKALRRDLGYQVRRTHSLERKLQAIERHQHGTDGGVMIKIQDTYSNEGSDCCSAAPDLLA